jgi:hypothetical protein
MRWRSFSRKSNSALATWPAIVTANAVVSTWFARRGRSWTSTATQFAAMAVVNLVLALVWIAIVSEQRDTEDSLRVLVFFVLMLTLIVTLYDRYRPIYDRRVELAGQSELSSESRWHRR